MWATSFRLAEATCRSHSIRLHCERSAEAAQANSSFPIRRRGSAGTASGYEVRCAVDNRQLPPVAGTRQCDCESAHWSRVLFQFRLVLPRKIVPRLLQGLRRESANPGRSVVELRSKLL